MIDSQSLKFDLFNRVEDDFEYWNTMLSVFGDDAEKYIHTGETRNEKIAWEYMNERLFSIQINMNVATGGSVIKEEIDFNIFQLSNDAVGVRYLNKWAEISQKIYEFAIGNYCKRCLELINELKRSDLTDETTISVFCERMTEVQPRAVKLAKRIVEEITNTLWYTQYPDLIRINYDILPDYLRINSPKTNKTNIRSNIKLKWNGNNRVLYDLFAQLTLINAQSGQTLIGNSIKELAQFLQENVDGLPTKETIEREIEKMREPNGIEKAKRGRIDLHITRDSD